MASTSARTGKKKDKKIIHKIPQEMTDHYVHSTLSLLRQNFEKILEQNETEKLSFEEMYRHSYALVLHKQAKTLYNLVKQILTEHVQIKVLQQVVDLLDADNSVRVMRTGIINEKNFVNGLNQVWTDYKKGLVEISNSLKYLDRVYTNQNCVDSVTTMGRTCFCHELLRHAEIRHRLQITIQEMKTSIHAEYQVTLDRSYEMLRVLGMQVERDDDDDDEDDMFVQKISP